MVMLLWFVYSFISGWMLGEYASKYDFSPWLPLVALILFNQLIYWAFIVKHI